MKKVSDVGKDMWATASQKEVYKDSVKISFRGSVLKKKKKEAFSVVIAAQVCDSGDNFLLFQSSTVLGAWNIRIHTYEIKVN